MNKVCHIMLIIVMALIASGCGEIKKIKNMAESQVPIFHQQFNDQNLEAIISAAHPDMFKRSSRAEYITYLASIRRKLGKVIESDNAKWKVWTKNGMTTVVLVQKTTYENGKGKETFTFRIENEKALLLKYIMIQKL